MKRLRWPMIYDTDMSFWWNIGNIWANITHPFRKVFHWIVKTTQYSKLLWNDFDWDYMYFLILMQYKLQRMRKCILEDNIILRSEEVAAQLKHAEDLIQRWLDDDFCTKEYEEHEKKWGKIVDLSTPIDVGGKKMYEWNMSREKATTEELQQQEKDEQHAIHVKAEEEKQKCLTELFAHIRKHIQEWWD